MKQSTQNINVGKTKIIFSISFLLVFLIPYGLIPYIFVYENSPVITEKLIKITLIGIIVNIFFMNFFMNFSNKSNYILLDFNLTNRFVFSIFLFFIIIIFATAPSIPVLDSIMGNKSADELSQSREDFLKTRIGWEQYLNYIIGMLSAYIIPYLLAYAHYHKVSNRWKYTIAFFIYCITFLEKAYFLKVAIPLLIIYIYSSRKPVWLAFKGIIFTFIIFFVLYNLAGLGESFDGIEDNDFFSLGYTADNTFLKIFWRAIAVPIITAFDALNVFLTDFNNTYFYGTTSSLIAFLMGEERFNFERYLYSTQFGGRGSGNANQMYIIEAYINFGYIGVVVFSIIIAFFFSAAIKSRDIVYIAVMPLFVYNLFNAGLLGLMFSNAYLLFYLLLRFIRFKRGYLNESII